jgi:ABC-type antimicrobial peptide transport system permease subunit
MKINGLIVSSHLSANEVQAYVNEMCRECEIIPSSYIDGATNSQSYIFGLNINQIIDALTTISLFLVIFACFILSVFMFTKIKQKLRYYAILSLCNFTMQELYMMITFEVMLFIIISNLLSFALSGIVFMIMQMPFKVQFLAYILVVDIVAALASILPSIHELHNSDMTVLFRRR